MEEKWEKRKRLRWGKERQKETGKEEQVEWEGRRSMSKTQAKKSALLRWEWLWLENPWTHQWERLMVS